MFSVCAHRSLNLTVSYNPFKTLRWLTVPANFSDGSSEEEHRDARKWLAKFNVNSIPKNICEVTFSRSSGPGGQNVNKYNPLPSQEALR